MNIESYKRIPYGITDYETIRTENYFYVDKTQFLKTIKEAGRYLFFIRPRRFGKSLFLSMMETYYDVLYKERFDELFKGTAIYNEPTDDRGSYLVLKFNFSQVDPSVDNVESSFLHHVRSRALLFLERYSGYLEEGGDYFKRTIEESRSASDILSSINDLYKQSDLKVYVIIDEYDNFANTILSTSGEKAYEKLTRGTGYFRSFFNVLKGGTDGTGAPFSRLFLTGVSPITLDDVTSGYNIGKNVSLESRFNRMLGFTEGDIGEMVEYYRGEGLIEHSTGYLLDIMREWYGNYLFSEDDNVKLFNPDMVLYFIDNYLTGKKPPKKLIDRNVRIDYGKLRYLILVDKGKRKSTNGNFKQLRKILEKGETTSEIEDGFPLEQLKDPKNFKSLLFYFGLLTIDSVVRNQPLLKIPNETVKRLYYDYIAEAYEETDIFNLDLARYSDLMSNMAYEGKWKPLFEFITDRMRESMSLRDLITGEKSIQAFLNVYLGLSSLYIIHTEKELRKGYADIAAEPFLAVYDDIKYSYIVEIKYVPKTKSKNEKELEGKIQRLKASAESQLKKYSPDEKFRRSIGKTTLVKLVLIFSGHDLVYIGEVN